MLLYYYGIDTIEKFEAAFDADYLWTEFKNEALLTTAAGQVTCED